MIDKIIEQPITVLVVLLLMTFGLFFVAFHQGTRSVSRALMWAAVFTLMAVIALLLGIDGGSPYSMPDD